jgi:hypothetical protein
LREKPGGNQRAISMQSACNQHAICMPSACHQHAIQPYNQRGRTWVREKPASIMA